ncbi:MAG: ubiquitin-like domain-containing protein, partial [Trebonia sp.]
MRRSVKYGLYGVVLAGLVGGSTAYAATPTHAVTLVVDGQAHRVDTVAATVGGVLQQQGYHPGRHDVLTPAAGARIRDGGTIDYMRGRLLQLDVDGAKSDVWTVATTVRGALSQLGYPLTSFTSVSASTALPLHATSITLRTPKQISVVHDGETQTVTSTDSEVRNVLADLRVTLGPKDRLTPASSTVITNGMKIVVQRVTSKQDTVHTSIAYQVVRKKDPSLYQGDTQMVTAGQNGTVATTYQDVFVDGKLTGRTQIAKKVVTAPTNKVENVGTKQRPAPPPPAPAPAPAAAPA